MKRNILATVLIVFLLAAFGQAQPSKQGQGKMGSCMEQSGQPGYGRFAPGMDRPGCAMRQHREGMNCAVDIPDLSDEQKAQLEKMQIEHMKSMQPLHNELAEKRVRLHTLSTAAEVNMPQLNSLIEEIGKLKTEMMKMREKHRQEVRKILNEKQRLFFDNQRGPGPHCGMEE